MIRSGAKNFAWVTVVTSPSAYDRVAEELRALHGAGIESCLMSFFEPLRGLQRPIRITQQLAREEHHVRTAALNDLVRLFGLGDHADGRRRDLTVAPDLL